jgi:hypothetical protein
MLQLLTDEDVALLPPPVEDGGRPPRVPPADEAVPPMPPPEDDVAAPWRPVKHGLGATAWQMMMAGR